MSPRKKTPSAVTFLDVVAAARKLPEIEVSTSYGTPSIKVRGKMLARLQEDGETLVLRTDFVARQILTQADPKDVMDKDASGACKLESYDATPSYEV